MQTKYPFKFLDAYTREDSDIFFGREEEVKALYEMVFQTDLLLIYGASGTGKTSLIQCGLASKFESHDWLALNIRRGKNLNASFQKALNDAGGSTSIGDNGQEETNTDQLDWLDEDWTSEAPSPVNKLSPLARSMQAIYLKHFKPIYLIFDQFEELFILDPEETEKVLFFQFIHRLLDTSLSCKIILVMREEFIAHLWDFEYLVPGIFTHRLRIKHLEKIAIQKIIEETFRKLEATEKIVVKEPEKIAELLLKKLAASKTGIALTYVQVFLDRLFQLAVQEEERPPVFRLEALKKIKTFEDVIDDFLEGQLNLLEAQLGPERKGIPLKILGAMVSNERTKKVLELEDIESLRERYNLTKDEMNTCLDAFTNMRILNRYES